MDDEMRQFMAAVNTKLDDILDRLSRDREDIDHTRGHIVITKLEDEIRRDRRGQT